MCSGHLFLISSASVAAAAAKLLQSCPTLCNPIDSSPPGSAVPGILQARILEWGAIAFSDICTAATAAAAKSLQSCLTLCDPIDSSQPGSPTPGILQARTGVGCHFLLQYMKVKSESEVAQSCLTLSHPMDCSLPGSSVHGILQARVLEWVPLPCLEPGIKPVFLAPPAMASTFSTTAPFCVANYTNMYCLRVNIMVLFLLLPIF